MADFFIGFFFTVHYLGESITGISGPFPTYQRGMANRRMLEAYSAQHDDTHTYIVQRGVVPQEFRLAPGTFRHLDMWAQIECEENGDIVRLAGTYYSNGSAHIAAHADNNDDRRKGWKWERYGVRRALVRNLRTPSPQPTSKPAKPSEPSSPPPTEPTPQSSEEESAATNPAA